MNFATVHFKKLCIFSMLLLTSRIVQVAVNAFNTEGVEYRHQVFLFNSVPLSCNINLGHEVLCRISFLWHFDIVGSGPVQSMVQLANGT